MTKDNIFGCLTLCLTAFVGIGIYAASGPTSGLDVREQPKNPPFVARCSQYAPSSFCQKSYDQYGSNHQWLALQMSLLDDMDAAHPHSPVFAQGLANSLLGSEDQHR